MSDYHVVYDAELIDSEISMSPFRLKKDIKLFNLKEIDLINIAKNIAIELKIGPNRPSYSVLCKDRNYICITCSKIRVEDSNSNKGKSKGFRTIVLIDGDEKVGFLLHLYKHSKGKDNITQKEENALKKVLAAYISERIKGEQ